MFTRIDRWTAGLTAPLFVVLTPSVALACGGVGFRTPAELVNRSQVIVRARVDGFVSGEGRGFQGTAGRVTFSLIAVLKGALPSTTLSLPGLLEDRDDRNDRAVPYDFVRPGGRHGNCVALGYRRGAEYLLLLRPSTSPDDRGSLTPYWASLAPTNEQTTGDGDPWIRWVSEQVAHPALPPEVSAPVAAAYRGIRDAKDWRNPRITVRADGIDVDAPTSTPFHRTVQRDELLQALLSLPPAAWPYGRVVLATDVHLRAADGSDAQPIRTNHEAVVKILEALDIVGDWWP